MSKDDATWLNICYSFTVLILSYIVYQAMFSIGVQLSWTERYDEWFPLVSTLFSIGCGLGLTYLLQKSPERREYHLSAITEIRKVAWPSADDTKKMTWVVVIVVAIFAVILAVFDIFWSKVLQWVIT